MKKLRLGIIGYGFMGQWHNNHAGTLEEVEIVAICDTDSEKRAEAPENVKLYTDYKALLADSDVEWVMISVPNHLHHDIAIDAAKAKKNIIVGGAGHTTETLRNVAGATDYFREFRLFYFVTRKDRKVWMFIWQRN